MNRPDIGAWLRVGVSIAGLLLVLLFVVVTVQSQLPASDVHALLFVGILIFPFVLVGVVLILARGVNQREIRTQSAMPARPPLPLLPRETTVPQTVTNTANYYIDTVNVYQHESLPNEPPVTVPAEVRRIRPAIGR